MWRSAYHHSLSIIARPLGPAPPAGRRRQLRGAGAQRAGGEPAGEGLGGRVSGAAAAGPAAQAGAISEFYRTSLVRLFPCFACLLFSLFVGLLVRFIHFEDTSLHRGRLRGGAEAIPGNGSLLGRWPRIHRRTAGQVAHAIPDTGRVSVTAGVFWPPVELCLLHHRRSGEEFSEMASAPPPRRPRCDEASWFCRLCSFFFSRVYRAHGAFALSLCLVPRMRPVPRWDGVS